MCVAKPKGSRQLLSKEQPARPRELTLHLRQAARWIVRVRSISRARKPNAWKPYEKPSSTSALAKHTPRRWIARLLLEGAVEIPDPVEVACLVAPAQTDKPRRGDVGILEIGVGDVRPQEIGAAELAAVEVGALEDRIA